MYYFYADCKPVFLYLVVGILCKEETFFFPSFSFFLLVLVWTHFCPTYYIPLLLLFLLMLSLVPGWPVGVISSCLWCLFDVSLLLSKHLVQSGVPDSLAPPEFQPGMDHVYTELTSLPLCYLNMMKSDPGFERED